jgi:glycosyltransferase involved in cell wall biosynthesis
MSEMKAARALRVGLVIYGDLNTISGGFLYDKMLVEALRRRGHHVEIISLPQRAYVSSLGDNLSQDLTRRLRDDRFDVVLQDELNHPALFWLNRRLKGELHYPIVSIVHLLQCNELRPAWQNRFYRWIETSYLKSVNAFIFNSHATRTAVQALAGAEQPFVVAYPGGDRLNPRLTLQKIITRANQPGPLRIIFIGNLVPRKELHTLLDALARLPKESWRLDVVGNLMVDTAYTHRVRIQIAHSNYVERVSLLGPLSDAILAERLAQSHVLAVPSSYEGFGIVYLEGMGFGLPAIASSVGGASEIITEGREGFLVNPNDAATLAQDIGRLTQDRQCLAQMSQAAFERYHQLPTWDESTRHMCDFVSQIASE